MTTLTWDQVVRFRAARHFLTQKISSGTGGEVANVIYTLGGVQAQVASAAELSLWARISGLKTGQLDQLLAEKLLVKTWGMNGLPYLFTADDLPFYVAAMRATRIGYRKLSWLKSFDTNLEEIEAIIAAVPVVLDGQSLTREDLAEGIVKVAKVPRQRDRLRSGWGDLLKPAAYHGHLIFGAGDGKNITFVRPDQWLPDWHEINPDEAVRVVARRYFAAYGPSTRDQFSEWWGGESRPFFRLLEHELVEVDVEGWKGLMLAEDISVVQNPPAESFVRLLPGFDHYTSAAYHDRSRLIADEFSPRVYRKNDVIAPVVVVDGRIAALWKYEQKRGRILVTIEPFAPLSSTAQNLLEAEVTRLGDFLSLPADLSYQKV